MEPKSIYKYTTYFCIVDYILPSHCDNEECVGCVLAALDLGAFHILRQRYRWHDPCLASKKHGMFRVDVNDAEVPLGKQEEMVFEIVRANMIRIGQIAGLVQETVDGEEEVRQKITLDDVKEFGAGHLYCFIPKKEPVFHHFEWTGLPEKWPRIATDVVMRTNA